MVCAREVSIAEVPIAGRDFCADIKVSSQRLRLFRLRRDMAWRKYLLARRNEMALPSALLFFDK